MLKYDNGKQVLISIVVRCKDISGNCKVVHTVLLNFVKTLHTTQIGIVNEKFGHHYG